MNHPLNLNDAMEFSFCIKSKEFSEKASEVEKGLEKYHKEVLETPEKRDYFSSVLNNIYSTDSGFNADRKQGFVSAIFNLIKYEQSEYKVCSFSEEKVLINPLMWGHYADKMQGVCLKYDIDENSFPIYKVRYNSNDMTPMVYPCRVLDKKVRGGAIRKTLRTKKKDWSYEREWRMIAKENFIKLPKEALKEVCFGYNCNPDKAEFLYDMIIKEYGDSVRFSVIVPDVVKYQMLKMSSEKLSIRELLGSAKSRVDSYEHFIQINGIYSTHWKDKV
ncbi:DUF2971 domain-containing protein [Halomonas aestuarii]|uniref:DUF2971 domain-containing protein n=1 Tax=Halomonas aestuarii TaxID=1897729 RepID=UPI0013DDD5C8|nr:DUF2971 domain-containing protein [Halomonas aestuarii]